MHFYEQFLLVYKMHSANRQRGSPHESATGQIWATNVVEVEHKGARFAEQYSVVTVRQRAQQACRTRHIRHHTARATVDVIALDVADVTAHDVSSAYDVDVAPVSNGRRRLDGCRQVPGYTTC